jgi:hypothetical protein
MQSKRQYLETVSNDDEYDLPEPKLPEEFVDRFGIRVSLLVLCVGLLTASVWMASRPSVDSCFALEDATERYACFDKFRADFLRPTAKGAQAPAAALDSPH